MESTAQTRSSDNPDDVDRIVRARNEGRKRTVIYSMIAAGIVALFIGRISEVTSSNNQVERNRTNCELIQEDRRAQVKIRLADAEFFQSQADRTLGNAKKGIKPINLNSGPFKDFKPLIIAQAHENQKRAAVSRQRAKEAQGRIENCKKVFPRLKAFWIV